MNIYFMAPNYSWFKNNKKKKYNHTFSEQEHG
jgi:hypothetical protein